MAEGFYENRLRKKHKLNVLIPAKGQIEYINNAIYNELAKGEIKDTTKEILLKIVHQLKRDGAEGIILGCTELPLIIKDSDIDIPLFNTLTIHLQAAFEFALD
jgi:aspartate racemase